MSSTEPSVVSSDATPDEDEPGSPSVPPRGQRIASWVIPAALYLIGGLFVMSRSWTHGPTTHSICNCGDPALFLWFMEWPAHAIAHLQNPFFSTAAMYPHGVNLLDATSVTAISLPLVPVTWLFGPVASLNVALTLAPALSALAAYALARRFVSHWPVAIAAGLIYGFGPYVLGVNAAAELMLSMAVVAPLIGICVDDLVRTRRSSPITVGVALGLLLALQFFIGTEMLLFYLLVLVPLCAVLLVASVFDGTWRRVIIGLATGAGTAVVVLIGPLLYALAGPAHLVGPAWGVAEDFGGNLWQSLWSYQRPAEAFWRLAQPVNGIHELPFPPPAYFGWPLLVLAACGLIARWRSRHAWVLAGVGFWAFLLSLSGIETLSVWRYLYTRPLLDSAIQSRAVVITIACVAVLACIGVDEIYGRLRAVRSASPASRWLSLSVAVVVVAVPLGVLAASVWPSVPYGTRAMVQPAWFATHGTHETQGTPILPNPPAFSGFENPLAWQALDAMRWSQPGIAGPQAVPFRSGREAQAVRVIRALVLYGSLYSWSPARFAAIRAGIEGWGIKLVVVPIETDDLAIDPAFTASYYTAALGTAPIVQSNAWVWRIHGPLPPALHVSNATLDRCSKLDASAGMEAVPHCVLRATSHV